MTEQEMIEKAEDLLTEALDDKYDEVIDTLDYAGGYTSLEGIAIALKLGGFLSAHDPYKHGKLIKMLHERGLDK